MNCVFYVFLFTLLIAVTCSLVKDTVCRVKDFFECFGLITIRYRFKVSTIQKITTDYDLLKTDDNLRRGVC